MPILTLNTEPLTSGVTVTDDALRIVLEDGREISVPLAWFPRLRDATTAQRSNWRLIGRGEGIHWPEIDEDVSTLGLLAGFESRSAAAE